MSQTIKLKRGLETNRPSITPLAGELVYTTDNLEVFFGDGLTAGGNEINYLNTRTGGTVNGKTTIASAVAKANGDANKNVLEVLDLNGDGLFEVTETGNAIIAGVLTVNGNGQSSFSGDVLVGGSLQVNGDATVAVDLAAESMTVTGDLAVNGNTTLGDTIGTDTTTINGVTTINSAVAIADGDANKNVLQVLDLNGDGLFEVTETGNAIIGGVLTVNGAGQSSFAGDVLIGGSLTVNGDATVAVDLSADTLTLTGDLAVDGNTRLGNEATDTTTINGTTTVNGLTTINSPVTIAEGDANINVFEVLGAEGAGLFEVTQTGDAIIAGVLTVNGSGQSSFVGDVSVGGSLNVSGDATVAVDLAAETLTLTGDLDVHGNTTLGNEATDTTTINGVTTINGNTSINGDLVVTGTTTTVNSNEVNIGDSIILLNSDETGAPSQNGGIEIERGTADNVALFWNESADAWYITKDATDETGPDTTSVRLLDTDDLTTIQNTIGAQALDDLSDVTITDVAVSDLVMFNGTEWVNTSVLDGGTF